MSVVIDGTTGVSGNNGTAATPTLRGDDPDTGIYFPSANTVAVSTGGALRAYVDSSGLYVTGQLIDITGNFATLRLINNGGLSGYAFFEMYGDGLAQISVADSAFTTGQLSFTIGGTERFRMGGAGELGIGGANYGTSGQVLTSGGSGAAPSWASVGTAMAGLTATAVGAYAYFTRSGDSLTYTVGSTIAASSLRYANANGQNSGTPTGTWRCHGYAAGTPNSVNTTTMWQRIS